MSRLCLKTAHDATDIMSDRMMAMAKPMGLVSIPLMRFIPKKLDMSVGSMSMMVTDVSVRMMVFMLLLIML